MERRPPSSSPLSPRENRLNRGRFSRAREGRGRLQRESERVRGRGETLGEQGLSSRGGRGMPAGGAIHNECIHIYTLYNSGIAPQAGGRPAGGAPGLPLAACANARMRGRAGAGARARARVSMAGDLGNEMRGRARE